MDYVDMMGAGYIIEHAVSWINGKNKRELCAAYFGDRLREIETALGGKDIKRLIELIRPDLVKTDDRTPEEIVADITAKAGLKVVGTGDGSAEPVSNAGA